MSDQGSDVTGAPGDPAALQATPPPASADRPANAAGGRWRHPALRIRAAVAFGLMALVLSSSLSFAAYALVRSSLLSERQVTAQRQAFTNARLLRSRVDPLPSDMSQLLASLQVGPSGDSLLEIDRRWFSSSVEVTAAELPPEVALTVSEGSVAAQRFEHFGRPSLVVGVPINAVGAHYYEISSLTEVESTLEQLGRSLAFAAVIATVFGALLGSGLTSVILQPLRRFAEVARRISDDESTSRLDAGGDADLEPLASSFNEMLDELDERIQRERRFASDVSHEIRGPVAALASALSIIERRRDQLPPELVPAIDALDEQVSAFNQLVLDLLEISRFDARTAQLQAEPADLEQFCREVLAERGHDRVVVANPTGVRCRVLLDRRRMEQVLSNLCENAAHYADGATDVTIEARGPDHVAFVVEDRGPGVDPDEREQIFARFERGAAADLPGAPRGTGLGLALSAQHVQLHGGSIWVEDRPGGGARFVVELPLAPDDEAVADDRTPHDQPGSDRTVLADRTVER
jgi:two-component system, OmpR family, sensor histidine kinase MtrB